MEKRELTALAKTLAGVMRQALDSMSARLDAFEQRFKEIPAGRDGKDADPELVKSLVTAEVKAAVDSLPVPKDGRDGRDGVDGQSIQGEPGKDGESIKGDPGEPGRPGKDADPEQIREAVRQAVAEIPLPKDGRDGKDAEVPDLAAIITGVAEVIPLPKDGEDGKDADPVDTEAIIAEVLRQIPTPANGKDGVDGKDGKSVDPETVEEMVARIVAKAIASIPAAKDGTDGQPGMPGSPGKDAEPIHPDTVALMIVNEVQKQIAAIPKAVDGADGQPGRDALNIDVLASIDEGKSYPRGTCAAVNGGTMIAARKTDPLGDNGNPELAGWTVIQDGLKDIDIQQNENDPRTFSITIIRTAGAKLVKEFFIPAIWYKHIFREGDEYTEGMAVTSGGSMWICVVEKTKARPGMGSPDWQLIVKKGADGKNGEAPKPPEPPRPVRLG